MRISTLVGLNLPQEPTSVNDIHICYLQHAIYKTFKSFSIASIIDLHFPHHNRQQQCTILL